jgi:predicted Zn finger-like uncharacterized protein
MHITCPNCQFTKTVDPARLPDRPVKVNCPRCQTSFSFEKPPGDVGMAADRSPDRIFCHRCGAVQFPASHCYQCGAALAMTAQDMKTVYAGFWIRAVAYLIDSALLGIVQFVLSLLIALIVGQLGFAATGDPAVNIVLWLFGVTISMGYAVFFVGYCGQTPGKMALRIKVIRTSGRPVSYGRAVLREVLGKFLSGILLGIGYLMVAFDRQKQGLHDKIADTYVIKL